jgi:hypothetical protein
MRSGCIAAIAAPLWHSFTVAFHNCVMYRPQHHSNVTEGDWLVRTAGRLIWPHSPFNLCHCTINMLALLLQVGLLSESCC